MAEEGAKAPAAPPAPEAATAAPTGGKSKKWLWIGIAAAVVVIAVACILVFVVFQDDIFGGSGGSSGPEQTVQDMFNAMEAKNVDAFFAIMDPQGLQQVEAAGLTVADFKAMLSEEMTYDSMTFSGVKMETKMAEDGQTAAVTIVEGKLTTVVSGESTVEDVKDSSEVQTYQVVLRDGKWYLDIASMQ
jgi:hypothetical protein